MNENERVIDEVIEPDIPEEVLALHPIAFQLMEAAIPGSNGEEFDLPEDALPELEAGVLEYEGEELGKVAETLTAFAAAMQAKHNSQNLANKILSVLQTPEIKARLKALSISADPEKVAAAARRFGEFSGAAPKTAPKVDAPKPAGAISLDKLNFPRRL